MAFHCAVPCCTNTNFAVSRSATKSSNLVYLERFPVSDVERYEKWTKFVSSMFSGLWTPSKSSHICSDHFVEEDYTYHYMHDLRDIVRILKPTAVPSILVRLNRKNAKRPPDHALDSKVPCLVCGRSFMVTMNYLIPNLPFCKQCKKIYFTQLSKYKKLRRSYPNEKRLNCPNGGGCDINYRCKNWCSACHFKKLRAILRIFGGFHFQPKHHSKPDAQTRPNLNPVVMLETLTEKNLASQGIRFYSKDDKKTFLKRRTSPQKPQHSRKKKKQPAAKPHGSHQPSRSGSNRGQECQDGASPADATTSGSVRSIEVYIFSCGHACDVCNSMAARGWLEESGYHTAPPADDEENGTHSHLPSHPPCSSVGPALGAGNGSRPFDLPSHPPCSSVRPALGAGNGFRPSGSPSNALSSPGQSQGRHNEDCVPSSASLEAHSCGGNIQVSSGPLSSHGNVHVTFSEPRTHHHHSEIHTSSDPVKCYNKIHTSSDPVKCYSKIHTSSDPVKCYNKIHTSSDPVQRHSIFHTSFDPVSHHGNANSSETLFKVPQTPIIKARHSSSKSHSDHKTVSLPSELLPFIEDIRTSLHSQLGNSNTPSVLTYPFHGQSETSSLSQLPVCISTAGQDPSSGGGRGKPVMKDGSSSSMTSLLQLPVCISTAGQDPSSGGGRGKPVMEDGSSSSMTSLLQLPVCISTPGQDPSSGGGRGKPVMKDGSSSSMTSLLPGSLQDNSALCHTALEVGHGQKLDADSILYTTTDDGAGPCRNIKDPPSCQSTRGRGRREKKSSYSLLDALREKNRRRRESNAISLLQAASVVAQIETEQPDCLLAKAESRDLDLSSSQTLGEDETTAESRDLDSSSSQTLGEDGTTAESKDLDSSSSQPLVKDGTTAESQDLDSSSSQTLGEDGTTAESKDLDSSSSQPLAEDGTTAESNDLDSSSLHLREATSESSGQVRHDDPMPQKARGIFHGQVLEPPRPKRKRYSEPDDGQKVDSHSASREIEKVGLPDLTSSLRADTEPVHDREVITATATATTQLERARRMLDGETVEISIGAKGKVTGKMWGLPPWRTGSAACLGETKMALLEKLSRPDACQSSNDSSVTSSVVDSS